MYLVDSNIIIYSYSEQYEYLRDLLYHELVYVSEISRVEVLGYHKLTPDEESYHQDFFKLIPIIYPTKEIFDKSIQVRRRYNLKLGDSIIAATALINNLTVCNRNITDFNRIDQLAYINPIRDNNT